MKTDTLAEVVERLREEERKLEGELGELEEKTESLREALERVRAGLSALVGKLRAGKEAGKGMPTEDVVKAIAAELAGGKTLSETELKTVVLERAQKTGRSGRGIAGSLKRALGNERFQKTGQGYKLK